MPAPAIETPEHSRAAGALLMFSAALSVLAMAHHPTGHGHGRTLLESLASIGPMARLVHGLLLALMLVQLLGQAGLATRLGWNRLVVQAAFIAQASGGLALLGAAAINGFGVAFVAERMVAARYVQPDQFKPVLWALAGNAQALAQIGTAVWALALVLWGGAVWSRQRALAVAVLPLVLVPLAGGLGLIPLDVIGFGAVVVSQALWAGAAGLLLWRGRL